MTVSGYLPWKSLFGQHSVAAKRRLLEPIAQIRIKIDPYILRQKCSPMSLVSDIWGLWGSSRGFLLAGPSNESGVLDNGYIQLFSWLRLRKLRRYGKQYYMTLCYPCWPANDWKINDLEWPWLAFSCQNPFSASIFWIRAFECHKITQPLQFCCVLCIEPPRVIIRRSADQPR